MPGLSEYCGRIVPSKKPWLLSLLSSTFYASSNVKQRSFHQKSILGVGLGTFLEAKLLDRQSERQI